MDCLLLLIFLLMLYRVKFFGVQDPVGDARDPFLHGGISSESIGQIFGLWFRGV